MSLWRKMDSGKRVSVERLRGGRMTQGDVIRKMTKCLDGGSPQECPFNEFSEHCPAESKENMVKWLKQPHRNK